jgi:hypothetical protein
MTPRTIFTLILKIFGLYLIWQLIIIIPFSFTAGSTLLYTQHDSSWTGIIALLLIIILLLYFMVIRMLLFKSNWVVDKLSLDKHFDQEIIAIKIDSAAVIQISIIVLGGVLFIDALPNFFREIITYLQQTSLEPYMVKDPKFAYIFLWGCKALLGYLLLTNSKRITHWVEEKNKAKEQVEESQSEDTEV